MNESPEEDDIGSSSTSPSISGIMARSTSESSLRKEPGTYNRDEEESAVF